jgi:hypothetical protein
MMEKGFKISVFDAFGKKSWKFFNLGVYKSEKSC